MKTGDVIIRRKAGTSLCRYAIVLEDGVEPTDWAAELIGEARRRAHATIAETGGEIVETEE